MAKPWGRYEIDFINGPKFRALNANAFALWFESKNYCDGYHTDGYFPVTVARTFRFYGGAAVTLLTRSCGQKPNSEPYAPLWEKVTIGDIPHYRLHDYLAHNDCRDKVLERIQKAEDERARRALAQKLYRERKKGERDRNVTGNGNGNGPHHEDDDFDNALHNQTSALPVQQKHLHRQRQNVLTS